MDFLGHVLSQEGVRPDLRKIESIKEWQNLILIKKGLVVPWIGQFI